MEKSEMKELWYLLRYRLTHLSKRTRQRCTALAFAGLSLVGLKKMLEEKVINDTQKFYLVDVLEDDKIKLYDFDGNDLNYHFTDKTKAIVDGLSSKTMQEVTLAENGNLTHGYIEKKYLSGNYYDSIETKDSIFDICYVSIPESVPLETYDHEAQTPISLRESSMVLASSDNYENRKEVLTVNEDCFVYGYINKDNLFYVNYDMNNDKAYIVEADSLELRKSNNETPSQITKGDEVKVIDNVQPYRDNQYGWYYVAYQNENTGKTEFGWIIGEDYTNNQVKYNLNNMQVTTQIPSIEQQETTQTTVTEEPSKKEINLQVNLKTGNLNIRKDASKDGKLLTKIPNKSTITSTQENYDNPVRVGDIEWVKVKTADGQDGWASKEYLKIVENNINSNLRTVDFRTFGNQNGYFGIDINIGTSPKSLDKILKNGMPYNNSSYVSSNEDLKPSYVIIKCGATGYGTGEMHYGTLYNSKLSKYNELIETCENNNVPFAIYYYSQAITEEEVKKELNVIKKANEIASRYSTYTNNIFIDFEYSATSRIFDNAKKYGKSHQTKILNSLLKSTSEIPNSIVHLYTDSNTMSYVINYNELLPEFQSDNWLVNTSATHERRLTGLNINNNNIGMFQIGGERIYDCAVDIDFMYEDFYKRFISKEKIQQPIEINQPIETNQEEQPVIEDITISSYAGVALDADTGEILYSKNGNEQLNPASITKVLTNYIVAKYGDMNDKVKYSEKAVKLEGSGYNVERTTKALIPVIKVGNEVSVKDAMHMSLMRSENSTTVALEEYIEKKTGKKFADLMNEEAKAMGCNNCNFISSYGNDDAKPEYKKHVVTAEDMAKIMAYINNNCKEVVEIMGTRTYTIEKGITINNIITALNPNNDNYIEGIKGGKNGSTTNAGKTLVTVYNRNGRTIVVVTLKAASYPQTYSDAKKLANYGFKKIESKPTVINQSFNYDFWNDYEEPARQKTLRI